MPIHKNRLQSYNFFFIYTSAHAHFFNFFGKTLVYSKYLLYLCTVIAICMSERLLDISHPLNICRASAGTGKTFTLAAYYVGLLLSGEDYRSILAITFTNKATAEMSSRILGYLQGIAEGREDDFLNRAKEFMVRGDGSAACGGDDSDEPLRKRAGECFRAMLLDYDSVRIQTIDSFLQTLLGGLASVLGTAVGVNTELDIDHIIRQAVDQLLTTELTPSDRAILEGYMHLKLDDESSWDVRKSLCMMAKELYNESVQTLDADGHILFDAASIARSREAIEAAWQTSDEVKALREHLFHCSPEGYNRNTTAGYKRLKDSLEAPKKMKSADLFRGVSEKSCNADEMLIAGELAARCKRLYNTLQLSIRFSRDMELMGSLTTLIQRNLNEANSELLAKTANTLSRALKAGDADFILEKSGIRYRHILIDEFQDTSRLQWSVIDRLIRDVLAGEGHTMLIVGDIKQSIYRWRNGDWHIMAGLNENKYYAPLIHRSFPQLVRNFRSSEEVVRFNLSLFRMIGSLREEWEKIYGEGFEGDNLDEFYQSKKKKGGYVRFRAFPKPAKEAIVYDLFDSMETILSRGGQAGDMMVLVREKSEATYITEMHTALDPESYPYLSRAAIVSADSFLLDASRDVNMVISGLKVVYNNDPVAAQMIELGFGSEALERVRELRAEKGREKRPLYEWVSDLISAVLCDLDGQYHGEETAYLNNLLDRTRMYVSTYGSSIAEFLTYWDDTMHAKAIPASSSDAVRIMTIHASKGLQAQTVFVPFCNWPKEAGAHPPKVWCEEAEEVKTVTGHQETYAPIQYGSEMAESAYQSAYATEQRDLQIDNLNMLYVALTRAEDNLFISADFGMTAKGELDARSHHIGEYLLAFTEIDGIEGVYERGEIKVKEDRSHSEEGHSYEAQLWSSSARVRFIQSQEGALYTDYGEESYRRLARMEEGTLCHAIFAQLRHADELDAVLDDFESRGLIATPEQWERLKTLISSAWEGSPRMREWFTAPYQLHLEEAIYIDQRELRPDRVMINPETNEAIVLDYKFGRWEKEYIAQVNEYKEALRRMGYSRVRGYLWFARNSIGKQLEEVYG